MRILVVGASGSGTTTLGVALAAQLGWEHLDTDDFYWFPTSPPFQRKRDAEERHDLLLRALVSTPDAVVSGSLVGWGSALENAFDLIVFSTSRRIYAWNACGAARSVGMGSAILPSCSGRRSMTPDLPRVGASPST